MCVCVSELVCHAMAHFVMTTRVVLVHCFAVQFTVYSEISQPLLYAIVIIAVAITCSCCCSALQLLLHFDCMSKFSQMANGFSFAESLNAME